MARAWNNGEGGTNGTTVTVGNSGGSSGIAWDLVTIGASSTLTYDNTHVEGALAYKLVIPATGPATFLEWAATIGTQTTLFVRVYVYLTANPAGGNLRLIQWWNGASVCGSVIINTTGQLILRDSAGAITGNTSAIALNQWVRIEASIVCSTTVGSIEAKFFNSADSGTATDTITKTGRNTLAQLTKTDIGETNAAGAITARTYWLDDVGVDTAGYLGTARAIGAQSAIAKPTGIADANATATVTTAPDALKAAALTGSTPTLAGQPNAVIGVAKCPSINPPIRGLTDGVIGVAKASAAVAGSVIYVHDSWSGTNAAHWNAADTGQTWTEVGTLFSEGAGVGNIQMTAVNTSKSARIVVAPRDIEVISGIKVDQLASGAALAGRIALRQVDANNAYLCGINIGPTGTVSLTTAKVEGGAITTFTTLDTGLTHSAGRQYYIRCQATGASPTRLRVKLWADSLTNEPWYWQWEDFDSTFAAGQVAGLAIGVRVNVPSGYTGTLPLNWTFDEFYGQDPTDTGAVAYRPFSADSVWNTPLPAGAPIDADSANILTYWLGSQGFDHVRISGCDFSAIWGIPYYWPVPGDPVHNVTSYGAAVPPEFATIRIPAGALPSDNSDSVMGIIDEAKGIAYDLHGVVYDSMSDTYTVDSGGVYYTESNGLAYDVEGSNNTKNRGHRGVPITTGAIRDDEIRAGVIRHVLRAAAYRNAPTYVWPMDGSDAIGTDPHAPPEGIRFRLKRSIDLQAASLTPIARIIAQAMQDYGVIVGDGSGANVEIKVENTDIEGRGTLFDDMNVKNNALQSFTFPDDFEMIERGYGQPVYGQTAPFDLAGRGTVAFYAEGASIGTPLRLTGWEVLDQAGAGWLSMQGTLERALLMRNPWLKDGATVVAFLAESGEPLFGGRTSDPATSPGSASIVGSGYGNLLSEQVDQFLVLDAASEDWSVLPADPFPDPWFIVAGGSISKESKYQCTTDGGTLKVAITDGTSFSGGEDAAFAFFAQGQDVHRFSCHVHDDNDAIWADYWLQVWWATFDPETGTFSDVTNAATIASPSDGLVVDVDTHPDGGDVLVVTITRNGAGTVTSGTTLYMDTLRVAGYADDDVFGIDEVAYRVFAQVGIAPGVIDAPGDNVAPLYLRSAPLSEAMLQGNLMTDTFTAVRGMFTPIGDVRMWGDEEWIAAPPYQVSLGDADRYYTVRVPFAYPSGKVTGYVVVSVPGAPRGRVYTLPVPDPQPDQATALTLANVTLSIVSRRRKGGSAETSAVFDRMGRRVSSHRVRSGALYWTPESDDALRIASVRHHAGGATLAFDPAIYMLNRLLAIRAARYELAGVLASGSFQGISI